MQYKRVTQRCLIEIQMLVTLFSYQAKRSSALAQFTTLQNAAK
jgi:hypothetical protein